jgi:hypothetical protein
MVDPTHCHPDMKKACADWKRRPVIARDHGFWWNSKRYRMENAMI